MRKSKYSYVLSGILIGSLFTMSAQVWADQYMRAVSAYVNELVTFEFNGEQKKLPQGYEVLIYNDRSYVPARFVAEELGAKVDWDDVTKTIKFTSQPVKEQDNDNEKPKETDTSSDTSEPQVSYRELPISKHFQEMNLEVLSVVTEDPEISSDAGTKIYVALENKERIGLQLLQRETKIVVDGVDYSMEKVLPYKLDSRWYNDVTYDETEEGYILIPKIPKDAKTMDLTLTVLKNDSKQEKIVVEYHIDLD
ncbi:MAG: stalk domain-containing protein [Bacillota bacterium]